MFIHLHNHSDYSLLDGACRIPELIETAIQQGANAVGLTDHGNMFGALDFYTKARDAGINPVIGCELYLATGSRLEKKPGRGGEMRYHQVLFAKNPTGYRNLSRLCSEGYVSGFYYKPRIDRELLQQYSEGIVCLSSCLQGEIPQLILAGDMDGARDAAIFYRDLFGDDFYIELQRHNLKEDSTVVPALAQLAADLGVKLVVTNDAHYMKREHAAAHDILLCVGTQAKRDEPNRIRFDSQEFYVKTPDEMRELFSDFPEALDNTVELADKCRVELELGKRHFPIFKLPEEPELTPDAYLERLAREGLPQRYNGDLPPDAEERLQTELSVIHQTGFANYFLIVADFVRWAKARDIPVGPGRGSAAGCLVAYCLGITNLDPIKYGLIFERFLNIERLSPPDIDIDFSDDRREEVIAYVREKYGQNSVCRITTFGRMAARSAVRDVARAMGLSYAEGDRMARLIPEGVKDMNLSRAVSEVPEIRELMRSDPRYKELIDHSLLAEGAVRHSSTHAAGVVICPGDAVEFLPIYKQGDEDEVYSQYDMYWLDAVGLLKMDFLGLQTLQEIDLTVKALAAKSVNVDIDKIPLDDAEVYRRFGEGDTIGVFQFESAGMRDNLAKLKPDRLEDLIAMNALYRPGPMQMIDDYIACRHGRRKVSYIHPLLEPILKDTYGVIVYQEQVIRIATELAGFSLGKADNLRWAMGKKKMDLMQSLKVEFIDGCIATGLPRKKAEEIYAVCETFANYGFVKAHSAGYALIAYQCAWLKTHHPADFLASCLTVRRRHPEQMMKLLAECRAQGIKVLPPDVNESELGFKATEGGIRFGLLAVKNVGEAAVEGILQARGKGGGFVDLFDFLTRVELPHINKRALESLIAAGAFDSFGVNRASLLASLPGAAAYAQALQEERERGQTTFFGGGGDTGSGGGVIGLPTPEIHRVPEWDWGEMQSREKEMLGYYVSSHPLSQFEREVNQLASHHLKDKWDFTDNQAVKVCCVVTGIRYQVTKKGDRMARVSVEDLTGSIECLVFPKTLTEYGGLLVVDRLLGITGRIGKNEEAEEPKLKVESVIDLREASANWGEIVRIKVQKGTFLNNKPLVDRIERIMANSPGRSVCYIDLVNPTGALQVMRIDKHKVQPSAQFLEEIEAIVGKNAVRLGSAG